MKNKELIEQAVSDFCRTVDCSSVLDNLKNNAESVALWVKKEMESDFSPEVKVASILVGLFEDCMCEVGETVAHKSTAAYMQDLEGYDPFGNILEVSGMNGHVWIRYEVSRKPLTHLEISMYDNTK